LRKEQKKNEEQNKYLISREKRQKTKKRKTKLEKRIKKRMKLAKETEKETKKRKKVLNIYLPVKNCKIKRKRRI
jgi:hypothetical protein